MIRRCLGLLTLLVVLSLFPLPVLAQDAGQRYESSTLGVAFDLPAGWQVVEGGIHIITGLLEHLHFLNKKGNAAIL